jgi:hypothetical protein
VATAVVNLQNARCNNKDSVGIFMIYNWTLGSVEDGNV